MYYSNSFSCTTLREAGAMPPVTAQSPTFLTDGEEALVYTMRDLNQRSAHIMGEIEKTGKTAFITRHGRFIAIITPLAPGQIESRVLVEMAREISKRVND
jgi:antitoxin (DNA-binding transcriptional repressor) of toxin-antitoxin stability system